MIGIAFFLIFFLAGHAAVSQTRDADLDDLRRTLESIPFRFRPLLQSSVSQEKNSSFTLLSSKVTAQSMWNTHTLVGAGVESLDFSNDPGGGPLHREIYRLQILRLKREGSTRLELRSTRESRPGAELEWKRYADEKSFSLSLSADEEDREYPEHLRAGVRSLKANAYLEFLPTKRLSWGAASALAEFDSRTDSLDGRRSSLELFGNIFLRPVRILPRFYRSDFSARLPHTPVSQALLKLRVFVEKDRARRLLRFAELRSVFDIFLLPRSGLHLEAWWTTDPLAYQTIWTQGLKAEISIFATRKTALGLGASLVRSSSLKYNIHLLSGQSWEGAFLWRF